MARYIDADALIKKIFPYDDVDKKCYTINAKMIYEAIAKAPTADVVPKSEWISVEERLPDTTPKELVILDQDISSGKIENQTDAGIAQVSETVAVLCKRCINGKVGLYYELDYTINGRWAYTEGVTHWMPLPEAQSENEKGR